MWSATQDARARIELGEAAAAMAAGGGGQARDVLVFAEPEMHAVVADNPQKLPARRAPPLNYVLAHRVLLSRVSRAVDRTKSEFIMIV